MTEWLSGRTLTDLEAADWRLQNAFAAGPGQAWQVGDRVKLRPDGETWVTGTVTAIDKPGEIEGVQVRFDRRFRGGWECYATHRELVRLDGEPQ